MTDLANLHTASLYINNQLLSRGLLRDGRPIDFANPTGRRRKDDGDQDSSREERSSKAESHMADTMARIISVVNDLILRRDVCDFPSPSAVKNRRRNNKGGGRGEDWRQEHYANLTNSLSSATPSTANPFLRPFAPSAPSHFARPTICNE